MWSFNDAMLDRAAKAFDNDDYVPIVIHSYRHRLGLEPGCEAYEDLERRLAKQPPIPVPAITLDAGRTATSWRPTGSAPPRTSPDPGSTARCRMRDITCLRKPRRPSPRPSSS
jgi:hypothetical protein